MSERYKKWVKDPNNRDTLEFMKLMVVFTILPPVLQRYAGLDPFMSTVVSFVIYYAFNMIYEANLKMEATSYVVFPDAHWRLPDGRQIVQTVYIQGNPQEVPQERVKQMVKEIEKVGFDTKKKRREYTSL